jgi:putative DNA primase/helicase
MQHKDNSECQKKDSGPRVPLLLKANPPECEPEVIDAEYVTRDSQPDVGRDAHQDDTPASGVANDNFSPISAPLRHLTASSGPDDINAAVREWATGVVGLPPVEQVTARAEAVRILKALGMQSAATLLDAALAEALAAGPDALDGDVSMSAGRFAPPVPWPDPVDGRELIKEMKSFVRRFVVMPSEYAYIALVLWALAAHAHDCFQVFPILVISSAVLRSGKTTVLTALSVLVPKPFFTSNATAASLFHTIDLFHPTVLIDEFDSFGIVNEALRGLLNSAHVRLYAFVTRATGEFSTWAAMVLALIGKVPRTVEDRAIIIPQQRRAPHESVERLRLDRLQEFEPLCRKAARWVKDHAEEIQVADPAMPSEMNSDRALDNWRPLFAIADAIGGDWPRRAREAAVAMSKADQEFDEEPATLLLQDLQMLFRLRGDDRIESREIVRSLVSMEDGPWVDYNRGRPLTERGLATILGLFRIKSQKWVVTEAGRRKWKRGYFLSDLEDTFARYVPAPPVGPLPKPTEPTEPPQAPQAPHVPPLPEPTGQSSEPPQAPQEPQPKPAKKKRTNPILPPPSRPRS